MASNAASVTVLKILLPAALLLGVAVVAAPPPEEQPSTTVRGTVVDRDVPVAAARVGLKGHAQRVETGARGTFALPVPRDANPRLVAAKPGYFIAGCDLPRQGPATLRLRKYPAEDWTGYRWIDPRPDPARPEACGNCHAEIFREWSQSIHAGSAVNRRFLNVYDGTDWQGNENIGWNLLEEFPEAAGACASCHAPSLPLEPAAMADLRKIGGVHRQGIHCDFCHKVAGVSIDRVGFDHGRFAMRLVRPRPPGKIFFGAMDDDDRGHSVYLPVYRQSRYCASCHEGVLFGSHAYSEYSEWLASPYAERGVQCQDCHMKPTATMTNVAPQNGGIERDPHTLPGHGSTRRDPDALRRCVSLTLEVDPSAGDVIEVVTKVAVDGVGHRTPTGYPGRQLILWVRALDPEGRELPQLAGPVLPPLAGEGSPAKGNLAGQPGWMYAKVFEDLDGRQPVPYWSVTRLAYDTRLMPDGVDRRRFTFRRRQGAAVVVARLIYRPFSKAVADEKGWPKNELLVAESQWSDKNRQEGDGGLFGQEAEVVQTANVQKTPIPFLALPFLGANSRKLPSPYGLPCSHLRGSEGFEAPVNEFPALPLVRRGGCGYLAR